MTSRTRDERETIIRCAETEEPWRAYGCRLVAVSVMSPHACTMLALELLLDVRMNHWPVDGRYTARSALPSPS